MSGAAEDPLGEDVGMEAPATQRVDVVELMERMMAMHAAQQKELLQTVLEKKSDAVGMPKGLKSPDYAELRDHKRHVRAWARGVEGWVSLVGWVVETEEAHAKVIQYLSTRF
jgi:hypothetical protein